MRVSLRSHRGAPPQVTRRATLHEEKLREWMSTWHSFKYFLWLAACQVEVYAGEGAEGYSSERGKVLESTQEPSTLRKARKDGGETAHEVGDNSRMSGWFSCGESRVKITRKCRHWRRGGGGTAETSVVFKSAEVEMNLQTGHDAEKRETKGAMSLQLWEKAVPRLQVPGGLYRGCHHFQCNRRKDHLFNWSASKIGPLNKQVCSAILRLKTK